MARNGDNLPGRKLTGRIIIEELLRNMESGQFEMAYTTLLPCIFKVYLHPEDYARLSSVFALISEDARRALTARVSKMNTVPTVLGIPRGQPREHRIAGNDWSIQFLADTEEAVPPGNIEIRSELNEAQQPGLKGTKTTLIDSPPVPNGAQTRDTRRASDRIHGEIRYEDDTGPQVFLITQNLIRVGRGAEDELMDLALYTNDEVSREHFVIRRDAATGHFFIVDKSTNGTWVDHRRLKRDIEVPLPESAEIKVAEALMLLFQVRK